MSPLAILLFFIVTWGLGFSVTRLVKEGESAFERFVMRIGIGLCTFLVLGIALNTLRVPLDWRIFLFLSAAGPVYWLLRKKRAITIRPSFGLKLKTSTLIYLALLSIFAFFFFMYASGAFKYPYFEDDDPWTHLRGVKFVSVEKTAFAPPGFSQYIDPYPPGYDMLFGILDQFSHSTNWTVKFFNALAISLSLLFFFFFAKEFLSSRAKALFATFVLASVPAYLSHFIWAPALAMVVFFPAIYAFEMVKNDRRWWIVSGLGISSLLLVHPTHAAILVGLIAIFVFVKSLSAAKWQERLKQTAPYIKAFILGVVLSLFWWGLKWKVFARTSKAGLKGGSEAATTAIQSAPNIFARLWTLITSVLNPESGTATRIYVLKDFVIATGASMINNPLGYGLVVSALAVAGFSFYLVRISRVVPKKKILLPILSVVLLVSTIALTGKTYAFQQQLFSAGSYLRPPTAPSYGGVFALSLFLVLLASAFLFSLLAVARNAGKEHSFVPAAIIIGWLLFAFLGVNNKTFDLPIGHFAL